MSKKNTPLVLVICDGYGYSELIENNAIRQADTPNFDRYFEEYPHTLLKSDGRTVGLPDGCTGTSEANHLTIGAGRIVNLIPTQIDVDIEDGSFYNKHELVEACTRLEGDQALHLIGLLSDGGVHTAWNHIEALIHLVKQYKVKKLYIHGILDGRDVPEKSADVYIKRLNTILEKEGVGELVSLVGRYYAMDRDTNYDRTETAYNLFYKGEGQKHHNLLHALKNAYKNGCKTDYYVEPICKIGDCLSEVGRIKEGDSVIFFNTRSDRARQIMYAMTDPDFKNFEREYKPVHFVALADYDQNYEKAIVAYNQPVVTQNLAHVLSDNGLKQLRVAETEKYAHVTFFFNSQVEDAVPGEDRILVPSPKVPSYDMQPEMSAYDVTEKILDSLDESYDVIIINFANLDLVGHSGVFEATKKAAEVVDECMGKIIDKTLEKGGVLLWTADHGNGEDMFDITTKEPNPSHTLNPVPFIVISPDYKKSKLRNTDVSMRDIAPTMLQLLDITKPEEMTGTTLFL
jgi:2,3-bisphosphoglycerate-independent phosphoglycerate mutase